MTDSLKSYDFDLDDDTEAQAEARRLVASNAADVEDARELLDALGLLSTGRTQPVAEASA